MQALMAEIADGGAVEAADARAAQLRAAFNGVLEAHGVAGCTPPHPAAATRLTARGVGGACGRIGGAEGWRGTLRARRRYAYGPSSIFHVYFETDPALARQVPHRALQLRICL